MRDLPSGQTNTHTHTQKHGQSKEPTCQNAILASNKFPKNCGKSYAVHVIGVMVEARSHIHSKPNGISTWAVPCFQGTIVYGYQLTKIKTKPYLIIEPGTIHKPYNRRTGSQEKWNSVVLSVASQLPLSWTEVQHVLKRGRSLEHNGMYGFRYHMENWTTAWHFHMPF